MLDLVWVRSPVISVLIRGDAPETHKGGSLERQAEIGEMQLQARGHQGLQGGPRSQEEARKDSSLDPSDGAWPC